MSFNEARQADRRQAVPRSCQNTFQRAELTSAGPQMLNTCGHALSWAASALPPLPPKSNSIGAAAPSCGPRCGNRGLREVQMPNRSGAPRVAHPPGEHRAHSRRRPHPVIVARNQQRRSGCPFNRNRRLATCVRAALSRGSVATSWATVVLARRRCGDCNS
jgi:hypothetical protein